MQADWWPEIAEALSATGEPWPEAAAAFDLRWHEDRSRGRRPSRRAFARRWRWTDWQARYLIEGAWWTDPIATASNGGTSTRQQPSQPPPESIPRTAHSRKGEPSKSPRIHPNTSSEPPADLPKPSSRAVDPPSPSPPSQLSGADLELLVAQLLALQQDEEPQHGLGQSKDVAALRRALGRGVEPDALRDLWAWSGASDDPDAEACRGNGWRRWSSLLKHPKGDERLELAAAWRRRREWKPVEPPPKREPLKAPPPREIKLRNPGGGLLGNLGSGGTKW